MSWRMGVLFGLLGCAPDTVAPGEQDLGDFDSWGTGIEDFVAAPVTDTGSTGTTDATYDGGYVGTFNDDFVLQWICMYVFERIVAGSHQQWIDFPPFMPSTSRHVIWDMEATRILLSLL